MTGDTAWVLMSTALVLFMSIPGLALFYGGLVRRKNVLSVFMQIFIFVAVISIEWIIIVYSNAFGTNSNLMLKPFIGGFDWAMLRNISINDLTPYFISHSQTNINGTQIGTILHIVFIIYQGMFAVIIPALITGAIAGLATITGAAGFVDVQSGLVIGILASIICFMMVAYLKPKPGYDDSLDTFGVHGVGGILGVILTGVFASPLIQSKFSGAIYGNFHQLWIQILAVGSTIVFSAIGTFVIYKVVDKSIGVRAFDAHEATGLDETIYGETAYTNFD